MAISKEKKALLHVGKRQLQLTDVEYRAAIYSAAGVSSSVDLDDAGFDKVMAEFARLGFSTSKAKVPADRREGMATPAQIGKINSLWRDYTGKDDESALRRWLEKHFHVSHVRFLKSAPAAKAVAVLGKMALHPNAKRNSGVYDDKPKAPQKAE